MSSCSWVQLSLIRRASCWPGSAYCGDDDEGLSITSGRRLYERATKATSDFDPIASAGISNSTSRNAMPGLSATALCAISSWDATFQNSRPNQSIRRRKPHHVSSLTASYAIEALERARGRRTAPLTASAWPISCSIELRVEARVRTRSLNSFSSARRQRGDRSRMVTSAPGPAANCAAYVPTAPPPRTTIFAWRLAHRRGESKPVGTNIRSWNGGQHTG
jgi:hypothetical protein